MDNFTLTMLDTSGIQGYVFRSNRLQENIGASEIVYRATTQWVFDALDTHKLRHNIIPGSRQTGAWDFDKEVRCLKDDPTLDVEVIYAGGGNTFLLFRDGKQAIDFTKTLTRRVLIDAPGLTLVVQHLPFDWNTDSLRVAQDKLFQQLAAHKAARLPSTPTLGLGITEPCASTGLAAVRTDEGTATIEDRSIELRVGDQRQEPPRAISRETFQKILWRDLALDRLKAEVGGSVSDQFDFPSDIDNLGRMVGEESFVAVVHADGNGMGEHVKQVGKSLDWSDPSAANRDYITELRAFSTRINAASLAALRRVVSLVVTSLQWDDEIKRYKMAETMILNGRYLPFRPLVFGGDDVTFLANGQLGLSLAVAYLEAFEEETKRSGLPKMHASAGVAIVKTHYPFSRAYTLSEELTRRAKNFVKQRNEGDQSALDWHFALAGLSGALAAIRAREYGERKERDAPRLLLRPLRLRAGVHTQDGRYWLDGVERLVLEFNNSADWQRRRNKVKGLREVLPTGAGAVEAYRRTYGLPLLPELLPGDQSATRSGWAGNRCVYFDAIELMDHHVPLHLPEASR